MASTVPARPITLRTEPRAPARSFDAVMADGVRLPVRVYGPPDAPRLVMSHGNGMAIDGYRMFWQPLSDAFQVVVFDVRNHGQSEGGASWRHTWPQFTDDVESLRRAIESALGPAPTVGVFHSLSAVASLLHLRRYGPGFDGLLLFDPPLLAPNGHPLQVLHREEMEQLVARVRRRRVHYRTPDELAAGFARNPAFSRWRADAYLDMARATLRPDTARGGWTLCCPPELEARIYDTNMDPTLWDCIAACPVPIKLVCGDPAVAGAQPSVHIGRAMAADLGFAYERVPHTTHFLQVEDPQACQAVVRRFWHENAATLLADRSNHNTQS